jgi:hypothetical protein
MAKSKGGKKPKEAKKAKGAFGGKQAPPFGKGGKKKSAAAC